MLVDCYTPESKSSGSNVSTDNLNNNQKIYPLYVEYGLITNVSGSAYLEIGTTKVICSINGPYAAQRKIFSNIGQIECHIRYSSSSLQHSNTQIQSSMIVDALEGSIRLEKYPKTVIGINIVVLETSGFELAPMITCASLALIDAAIEVIDIVCASSLSRIPSSSPFIPFPISKFVTSPSPSPSLTSSSSSSTTTTETCDTITVATIPSQNMISQVWFDGSINNPLIVQDMMNACCVFNKELRVDLRRKLVDKVMK